MSATEQWIPFLTQLVDREDRRKSALETRSTGLATIGAAVIAILTGASAIGVRTQISVPRSATIAVVVAIILFLVSLIAAIVANLPVRLRQTDPSQLLSQMRILAEDPVESSRRRIVATLVDDYANLNSINNFKVVVLAIGLGSQLFGCAALAVFILQTL